MISNADLVFYACVSKGTTILAEFTSGDTNLETLASKCLENTPPFHSIFTHTVQKRTYTFLIDGPDFFVYFAIFDENLEKSEGLWFLNRLKQAIDAIVEKDSINRSDNLSSHFFQCEFNPIFSELLTSRVEFEPVSSVQSALRDDRDVSLESAKGKRMVSVPLLGKVSRGLKKKKRLSGEINGERSKDIMVEKIVDVCADDNGGNLSREFSMSMNKNGLYVGEGGGGRRQKVKQVWRRHVWVVLVIDLFVCTVLFMIWLWICRGFKCIAG